MLLCGHEYFCRHDTGAYGGNLIMVAWERIRTVLLDMDGTLLDLRFDNYFWNEYLPDRWGSRRGIDPGAARAELLARIARCVGTLDWYCLDFWLGERGGE